jgi:hypothetical protein
MVATIFPNIKSSSRSGKANIEKWILSFVPVDGSRTIDPVMGWTSSNDMMQELIMHFNSLEEAESFAKKNNIEYEVIQRKRSNIHLRSYADNFK